MMIIKILQKLGLAKNEAKAYIGLVEFGQQTAGKLAQLIKINRTTLYGILKSLVKKGFVTNFEDELAVTYYKSIEPERLLYLVERQEEEIKKVKIDLKDSISHLKSLSKKDESIPKVKYFEGLKGIKTLYLDTVLNNKEKFLRCFTDYEAAYKFLKSFSNEYYSLRIKNKVKVQSILPNSERGREDLKITKKVLRKMKFLPIMEKLEIEINIYDDKVAIISFNSQNPHGILIQSQVIAQAMKNIYKYVWKI